MRLKSLHYSQFREDPREWDLNGLVLSDINLVVGKNGVGKSKSLNVINGLSLILSTGTKLKFGEGSYHVVFDDDGDTISYILEYRDNKVYNERFQKGSRVLLTRGKGGIGKIFAEKENKDIDFQTPEDEIAAVARRDSLQHAYLEPLYQWASRVLFYHFGASLGKENLRLFSFGASVQEVASIDLRNENALIDIYQRGWNEFGDRFDLAIREDMQAIGYELEDIGVDVIHRFQDASGIIGSGALVGVFVKEKDLPCRTDHAEISTGMFRALSLFVQINYALMTNYPSCILVDDIGEGLDYARSCALIERLMHKAKQAGIQLVMSTNDRFVMNSVPLEYWSILRRKGGHIKVFNYGNSRQAFDDFKFSGLNNFDFFAYDYLSEDPIAEELNVEAGHLR